MRGLILCGFWAILWGVISLWAEIPVHEVTWWLIAIFGSLFILFAVKD